MKKLFILVFLVGIFLLGTVAAHSAPYYHSHNPVKKMYVAPHHLKMMPSPMSTSKRYVAYGDVNMNGVVNYADLEALRMQPLASCARVIADVTKDGIVNNYDYAKLKNRIDRQLPLGNVRRPC